MYIGSRNPLYLQVIERGRALGGRNSACFVFRYSCQQFVAGRGTATRTVNVNRFMAVKTSCTSTAIDFTTNRFFYTRNI